MPRVATGKTQPVRVRQDVLRMARMVANLREIDVSQYLSDLVAPLVSRDLKAEKQKILKEEGEAVTPRR